MNNMYRKLIYPFLFFIGFSINAEEVSPKKIAVFITSDGLGDYAFNDSTYNGCIETAKRYSGTFYYGEQKESFGQNIEIQLSSPEYSKSKAEIEKTIADGFELIIGVSFMYSYPIEDLYKKYPNTQFVLIDSAIPNIGNSENLVCYTYKEEQFSFLLGSLAGLVCQDAGPSNKVAFLGGRDVSVTNIYKYGFISGAIFANKELDYPAMFLVNYVGNYSDMKATRKMAMDQFSNGAYVIFGALNNNGLKQISEAAYLNNKFAFGIDGDKISEQIDNGKRYIANHILATALKRIDNTILFSIKNFINQTPEKGHVELGFAGNFIDVIINYNGNPELSKYNDTIQNIRTMIGNNEITIPKDEREFIMYNEMKKAFAERMLFPYP